MELGMSGSMEMVPTTVLKDQTLDTRGVLVHLMSGESILIYLWASWSLEQPCGNALL